MIIEFEGIDGSGKGTQVKLTEEHLRKKYALPVHKQMFPDRTTLLGRIIDSILKGEIDVGEKQPEILQGIMIANRLEKMNELRRTGAFERKAFLLFDRYWGSGFAYGKADGLDEKWLVETMSALPSPDIRFLLDIPPEYSIQRRPNNREKYEQSTERLYNARRAYLRMWSELKPGKDKTIYVIIDATKSIEDVQFAIQMHISMLSFGKVPLRAD